VLFGEHIRKDPAISHLSFTGIAKETGKRWREISYEERLNLWETPAADMLKVYKEELKRYKRTENCQNYQTYLKEFKQGLHNPASIISSENKVSSASESASPSMLPASQGQEEFNVPPKTPTYL
jgi:hypothetical protein